MRARLGLNVFAACAGGLLLLPIVAVVPVAFSQKTFVALPPDGYSLRWWGVFFADRTWFAALWTSLLVALLSSALALVAGTAASLGLARLRPVMRALATGLLLGPVVTPVIVLAVGLYAVARATGLVGTMAGLVLAHAMLALPFVALNVSVSLAALDPRLELAASGLGASAWRVFRTVTLPLILPGVAGGGVFAFVTSFDDVVLAIFLSGPRMKTLPVRIWEEIRVEYTPVVAVAATIMIALALICALMTRLARKPA